MEDRIPVSPRQDEIQGRLHGGSTVAPITPGIGSLGCDTGDIFSARAGDITETMDIATHAGGTREEDLLRIIHRLESENSVLRAAQEEEITDAEESAQLITALNQRIHEDRIQQARKKSSRESPASSAGGLVSSEFTSHVKPPRTSVGGLTFGKDLMHEWKLSPAMQDSDISKMESSFVQAQFHERVRISRSNFDNASRVNEAKDIVNSTVHQFPRGMNCNLIFFIFTHPRLDLTGMAQILDRDEVRIPDQVVAAYQWSNPRWTKVADKWGQPPISILDWNKLLYQCLDKVSHQLGHRKARILHSFDEVIPNWERTGRVLTKDALDFCA